MSEQIIIGSGGGCFPGSAMVMTPEGECRIDQLKVGDEVLSFDQRGEVAVSKVQVVHTHPSDTILRVRYWGGELRITANHWVLNQYNTFAAVGTLTEHDAMVDSLGHLRPVLAIDLDGEEPVFNLTVTPNHTFICDGIRVHNGGRGSNRPVIGSGGGGKGGGGRAAVEDPDSLFSHQYAKLIDLISEGEIGGLVNGLQSVFLNDTPIQNPDGTNNFSGVTLAWRNGTHDQTPIPGFADVENEYLVNVQVKKNNPIIRTIVSDADAARVTIAIPSLNLQDTTTGDLHGTSIDLAIEVQNNGGGFQPVALNYQWLDAGSAVQNPDGTVEFAVSDAYGIGVFFAIETPKETVSSGGNEGFGESNGGDTDSDPGEHDTSDRDGDGNGRGDPSAGATGTSGSDRGDADSDSGGGGDGRGDSGGSEGGEGRD